MTTTYKKPIVSWWMDSKEENGTIKQVSTNLWDLGTVKAGNQATANDTAQTFYIWNNKQGDAPVQRMVGGDKDNCKITIRDGNTTDGMYHEGNADTPWVRQEWFEARLIKNNPTPNGGDVIPTTWTKIGFNTTTNKEDYMPVEAYSPDNTGSVAFGTGEIAGLINDGTFTNNNNKNNYAKLQIRMVVPPDADAGQINFIVRLYYSTNASI